MNIIRAIPHTCYNLYKVVSEPSIIVDVATKVIKASVWTGCTALGSYLCVNPITIPLGGAVLIGCAYLAYIAIDKEISRRRANKPPSLPLVVPQPRVEEVRREATRTTTVKIRCYPKRETNHFPAEAPSRSITLPRAYPRENAQPRMYIDPSVEHLILGALGRTPPIIPLDNHLVVSNRIHTVMEKPTPVDTSIFETLDRDEGFFEIEITTRETLTEVRNEVVKSKKRHSSTRDIKSFLSNIGLVAFKEAKRIHEALSYE